MAALVGQIVRGLLTAGSWGTCLWMWAHGATPPDVLFGAASLFAGTYFKELSKVVGKGSGG